MRRNGKRFASGIRVRLDAAPPKMSMPPVSGDPPGYNLHFALSLYARQNARPVIAQRHTLMASVAGLYPRASALEQEIWEIQGRLGTLWERPGDLERVNAAAHTLSNMICAALLAGDARSTAKS